MDDEFEPFETTYQTIFDHLTNEGKFISFELSHCMEDTLKESPYYNKYCVDKVNFRHLLEAKYKKDYRIILIIVCVVTRMGFEPMNVSLRGI